MSEPNDPHALSDAERKTLRDETRALQRALATTSRVAEAEKRRLEYRAGYSIWDANLLAQHHIYAVANAVMTQVAADLRNAADQQIDVRFRPDPARYCASCGEPIYSRCGTCRSDGGAPCHVLCALCLAKRQRGLEAECVPCALRQPATETPHYNRDQ